MKRRVKFLLLVLCFVFSISAFLLNVKAEDIIYTNTTRTQVVYKYTIEKYDVNIDVNANNVLEITEVIGVNFKEARHGIIRKIPLRNTVKRVDGSTTRNSVRLTDLDVSEKYKGSTDSGYKVIQIGDADQLITGNHEYVIKYKYNLGKDSSKDMDELYFNIIGTEWDTEINNVSFTINMPSSFDASKLGFSTGKYGVEGSTIVDYRVEGNTITGYLTGKLDKGEGLTVRCELPEGYFVNAGIKLPILFPLMFIVPFLSAIIAFVLWNKYGKDDIVIETVEFYPPDGCNSTDVAYFYKSSVSHKDANSLLIYLASKGYLRIVELDNDSYRIIKLKDYDGENVNERLFMQGLFSKKNEVTKTDLYNNFYKTIEKIVMNANSLKNRVLVYDSKAGSMRFYAILLAMLSIIVTVAVPTLDYGTFADLFPACLFGIILTLFLAVALFANFPIVVRICIAIPVVIVGFLLSTELPLYYAALANTLTFIAILFGIIATLVVCFFIRYMSKRTPYGNEMYGKVKGFKTFLETAEKEKLESLVNDNPSYFYTILPYTYVLGISDKWIKKFESIMISEPEWYESNRPFDINRFDRFIYSTMSSATDREIDTSNSSFGGGFSGGGFSGGGSGGGGGSSW